MSLQQRFQILTYLLKLLVYVSSLSVRTCALIGKMSLLEAVSTQVNLQDMQEVYMFKAESWQQTKTLAASRALGLAITLVSCITQHMQLYLAK